MKRCHTESAWFVIVVVVMIIGVFFVASSTQAAGNIYYVATNGSDSYSCSQARNISTPKRNIMTQEGGIACIQGPGDKLLIRGGTYNETISNFSLYSGSSPSWPPGTSWDNAITVAAYNGEITKVNGIALGDCCANPALPSPLLDFRRHSYRTDFHSGTRGPRAFHQPGCQWRQAKWHYVCFRRWQFYGVHQYGSPRLR